MPESSPVDREWLVTNGLGGYASGTVRGPSTRRHHGLLVAALPGSTGRAMMLDSLAEQVGRDDRGFGDLEGEDVEAEFRLDLGLPAWTFRADGWTIERRVRMARGWNLTIISYRLDPGTAAVRIRLRPLVAFRKHDDELASVAPELYSWAEADGELALAGPEPFPSLTLAVIGATPRFRAQPAAIGPSRYATEADRGYASEATLFRPGTWEFDLEPGGSVAVIATTDGPEAIRGFDVDRLDWDERNRRLALIRAAGPAVADPVGARLVLAADAFLVRPPGGEGRTVIAGYHWFTDWGRDAMIGLEGLALTTGRAAEAAEVLEHFASAVQDGLIPNLFPEGVSEGVYHTADATLWFFHALDRYVEATGNLALIDRLLPKLAAIVEAHLEGTRFGIGVDPADDLLRQGEAGYQLTWMDAKVGDWVVTPRRGKAVEINALWYNALRLLEGWTRDRWDLAEADRLGQQAEWAYRSFNARFPNGAGGALFDVVDGEWGSDPSIRPNQLLSFTLRHPVLDPSRWAGVLEAARSRLLTPVGLRSLDPADHHYHPRYAGDVRARDSAYHRGTAWSWLIGPYVDAHLKVHPGDRAGARAVLAGLVAHLDEAGVGTVSEVFDGDDPHRPGGCIAQAWGVAELLRCWAKTAEGGDLGLTAPPPAALH